MEKKEPKRGELVENLANPDAIEILNYNPEADSKGVIISAKELIKRGFSVEEVEQIYLIPRTLFLK